MTGWTASLLLLVVTVTQSCCAPGMFEPPNVGLNYQAEERNNVTVEWRFSSKADISIPSLKIHCQFVLPELKVFYHLDHGAEWSQHEQFAGRVQCDKDALRTGRVRLQLIRVRTDDSGRYLCRMVTGSVKKVQEFSLHVAAKPPQATAEPISVRPEPEPGSRGRPGLYAGLGLAAAAAAVAVAAAAGLAARRWTSHAALHNT
ncbi:uncharacterized protein LOC143317073 [Chaetodon auriga]|uniref:uncharacterized protein LOC143317073 n=1 Tax=Chaetodon auriga TaxID=39042 RepID=UPI004032A963